MRILLVEDSDTVAMLLTAIFSAEPHMEVVGRARNGKEALTLIEEVRPDVITMDIRMPEMDGFEATRIIMSSNPTPIVVISSSIDDEELKITFRAIEAGALTVLEKPRGTTHADFEARRAELVNTVRAMAEVKVVRRKAKVPLRQVKDDTRVAPPAHDGAYRLLAIGCSTGGPLALKTILETMPAGFPIPMVVVQHISPGFLGGMISWLQDFTPLKLHLAENYGALLPGHVYFAPDGYHLTVTRDNEQLLAQLNDDKPVKGFRPSATPLLESVARACGDDAIGCLLTGMGDDGALGLQKLHNAKSYTFVQDEESCVVFGMPAAALAIGATTNLIQLSNISQHLQQLAEQSNT